MPPKGVAKARVKAKAKARAKHSARPAAVDPGRAVPGRLRLRRPAAAPPEETEAEVNLTSLGLGDLLKVGALYIRGKYWDSPVELAGIPKGFVEKDGEHYVRLEARGTRQESLLRYLSGKADKEVLLHLCEQPCSRMLWADGVVHIETVKKVQGSPEEWMTNAMVVKDPLAAPQDVDELAALRADQARLPPGMGEEESLEDKKKRKEKEAKDRRKKESELKPTSSKKPKMRARKGLEEVFGSTGMDPDPGARRRLRHKAKRMRKKKKTKKRKASSLSGSSSPGSNGSSSSEGSAQEAGQGAELFGETLLVRKIGLRFPGVLSASWIQECQDVLMTSQGQLWSQVEGSLPPLAVQYYRQVVSPRMGGPMGRE